MRIKCFTCGRGAWVGPGDLEFYKDLFAHDIKNILQGIFSGMELNELYLQNPEKFNELVLRFLSKI